MKCTLRWALGCVVLPVMIARGQDTTCTYMACGVRIAPAWNALDVVKGPEGTRVTGLGFFWPNDVRPALSVNDSAAFYAGRAVKVRRVAALLTDAGAIALAVAVVRRAHDGAFTSSNRAVAIAGATSLVASIPLQFLADGLLSRSVWWFNSSLRR